MMKHIASLAMTALLLAACGGEEPEATEQQAQEVEATANDLLERMDASFDSLQAHEDSSSNADSAAEDATETTP